MSGPQYLQHLRFLRCARHSQLVHLELLHVIHRELNKNHPVDKAMVGKDLRTESRIHFVLLRREGGGGRDEGGEKTSGEVKKGDR